MLFVPNPFAGTQPCFCAAASGDIERVDLHILCHRTARCDIRAVSDLYRRNQIAVAADKDIVADLRAIFVRAVIIDKDYAAAQIYTAADIRITDIGQVRGLRAVSEAGVFISTKSPTLQFAPTTVCGRR